LCAPLTLFGRPVGVIYLTATDPSTHFDEEHLRLVTIISGVAAVAINNARHVEQLERENSLLREESRVEHGMVGESEAMRRVYQFIARVALTDSTVLIRGESGTGKELAAQALHQNSARSSRPLVAINCAALTETLLESELFGHERGAFTGALTQKKGKLEVADGGTLFLDEVGELAPVMQAKLLRVLQEREFERVGGTRTIRVDVRVVTATNRDLEEAVRAGTFRQDLYYRLNVVSFEMPPLRERREDIPLLASYFAAKYAAKFKRKVTGLSPEARECLVSYDWPGNVRELENAIERAVVLGSTERVLPEDLPENVLEAEPQTGNAPAAVGRYHDALREAKRQLILRALELSGGSFTEAARALGVHPNYLHRLIRNLNLRPELKK
jgi:Nif-specific regulatory protein